MIFPSPEDQKVKRLPWKGKPVSKSTALLVGLLLTVLPPGSFLRQPVAAQEIAGGESSRLSPTQVAAIDGEIQAQMSADGVAGVAIGVLQHGQIVYLKGYGKADDQGNPITTRTMFRWASCSKSMTAIAALQLVEQGKLDLDADVRHYVPEFPDKGVVITPREILCHQSGIPHYANGNIIRTKASYATPHPFDDVVTALDKFKESPLLFAPGAKYSYSTYAYILLSAVVQRAGGQRFADQVQQRITVPLGMTTAQPDYQWKRIPNRAGGFEKKPDGAIQNSPDTDVSWKLGGGGFISTIGDMARFAQGLLNHKLVDARTEALMWTPQQTRSGEATGDGLGFFVTGSPGTSNFRVFHDGAQEKTRTRFVLYPHRMDGVVVMTNCEWGEPGHFSTAVYRALAKAR